MNIIAYIKLNAVKARVRDVVSRILFTNFRKKGAINPPTLQPIKIRLLAILPWDPFTNLETSANKYGMQRDWENAINTMQSKNIYISLPKIAKTIFTII